MNVSLYSLYFVEAVADDVARVRVGQAVEPRVVDVERVAARPRRVVPHHLDSTPNTMSWPSKFKNAILLLVKVTKMLS